MIKLKIVSFSHSYTQMPPRVRPTACSAEGSAGDGDRKPPGGGGGGGRIGAPQSRFGKRKVAPGTCPNCGVHEEDCSMWRRDLIFNNGDKVCNACGIYAKDHNKPRPATVYQRRARLREAQRNAMAGPSSSNAAGQASISAALTGPDPPEPGPSETTPIDPVPTEVLLQDQALVRAALLLFDLRDIVNANALNGAPATAETELEAPQGSSSAASTVSAEDPVATPSPRQPRLICRLPRLRAAAHEESGPAVPVEDTSGSEGSPTSEEQSPQLVTPAGSPASLPDRRADMTAGALQDKQRGGDSEPETI